MISFKEYLNEKVYNKKFNSNMNDTIHIENKKERNPFVAGMSKPKTIKADKGKGSYDRKKFKKFDMD